MIVLAILKPSVYSSQNTCSFDRTFWLTILTYDQTCGVFVWILSYDWPLFVSASTHTHNLCEYSISWINLRVSSAVISLHHAIFQYSSSGWSHWAYLCISLLEIWKVKQASLQNQVSQWGQEETATICKTKNLQPLSELFICSNAQKLANALTKLPLQTYVCT